jgi:hypothetical protein
MKRNLFLFALVMIMPFIVRAQITVTQADFASIGENIIQATDTLPVVAISPGSAGANQTWDFSALHNHYSTTYNFITVSSTPFATSYPMANLSAAVPGPFYNFMNSSASSVQLWGYGGDLLNDGTQHALVYSNPEKMVLFPSTYNTPLNDTSKYDVKFYYGHNITYGGNTYFIDSVRQKETNYIAGGIDAWGTATTPDGDFPVLRNNSMKHTIDSLWVRVQLYSLWVNYSSSNQHIQSYGFIGNGIKYVLVNILYYPDSTAIQKVDWTRATPVSINETAFSNAAITYPNPANEFLYVNNQRGKNVQAVIYDIEGREVVNTIIAGTNVTTIPLLNLNDGVYILKLFNNSGLMKTEKLLIKH